LGSQAEASQPRSGGGEGAAAPVDKPGEAFVYLLEELRNNSRKRTIQT